MNCISTQRMKVKPSASALYGKVVWTPARSLWAVFMTLTAIIVGPLTFSWSAFGLLVVTSTITLCVGHSVGMHRLLIHQSFTTPQWLENVFVYLGTLVGMAGPYGMIKAHDIRDWAQRQQQVHDLYAHRQVWYIDMIWQMHCKVELVDGPQFSLTEKETSNSFYRFLEWSWMLQQLPWAVLFYLLGGWSWVVWGIAVRIAISLHGHWFIGHLAHRGGEQIWSIDDVAVQGYNLKHCGLFTFGESWHGNHHAYPQSARLGLERGQLDPGWWFISFLRVIGLATKIRQPYNIEPRKGLRLNKSNKEFSGSGVIFPTQKKV